MTNDSYRAALEVSKRRLRTLIQQREELNREIARLQAAIVANANMLDDPEETAEELMDMTDIVTPTGLTDAVRRALQTAGKGGLTPVETREAVIKANLDLSQYSNPLSAIHTILKRLVKKEQARVAISDRDESVYQWIGKEDLGTLRNRFIEASKRVAGGAPLDQSPSRPSVGQRVIRGRKKD